MIAEAESTADADRRRECHRHVGDFTLFWTGVYPESLAMLRSSLSADHLVDYQQQGKRSYYLASTYAARDDAPVFAGSAMSSSCAPSGSPGCARNGKPCPARRQAAGHCRSSGSERKRLPPGGGRRSTLLRSRTGPATDPGADRRAPAVRPSRGETGAAVDETQRFRLDDLRRHAAALGAAAGLARDRAATLAGHLLWYDAAGRPELGLRRLPGWLDRIEQGTIDPHAEPRIGLEHPGTAVLDGGNGLPPWSWPVPRRWPARRLARSAWAWCGSATCSPSTRRPRSPPIWPLAHFAAILGPRPSWTLAVPSAAGLPAVFDTDLEAAASTDDGVAPTFGVAPSWVERLGPWAAGLVPEGDWLILALAVTALEPLASFQDRVAAAVGGNTESAADTLRPAARDAHRRAVREQGVPIDPATRAALDRHAVRLGVAALV